jgi:HlyD family secretion protein
MADELSADLASLRIDRSSPPPKRSWGWVVWLALAGGGVAAGRSYWPEIEGSVFKTKVEITAISTVSPSQSAVALTAAGYVQAERNSRIAPKVSGRVLKVYVTQGQEVEAGDPLIELDPADEASNIQAAQARVAAAIAQAKSAEARVATAEAEHTEALMRAARERKLAGQGVSAAAQAEDLEARATSVGETVKAAKAAATAASAEAQALSAQVQVLRTGLKNLTLSAPIKGRIVTKPPQIGEFMGPQPAGVSVDMGGVRVADFASLLVETDIPEARLSLVKLGAPAEIVLDAYPSKRYRGRVKEITPQVDRAKATVLVKVEFVDERDGALPDMSARVSFLEKELDAAKMAEAPKKVVPKGAVVERNGSKVVFVVNEGVVRMVSVQLGPEFGGGYELISGPESGAQLVDQPPATLKDGQKVQEKDAAGE